MTTEGLIQKLFAGYIEASEEGHLYKQLQEELIAEIKKMETTEGDFYDDSFYVDIKELIGEE